MKIDGKNIAEGILARLKHGPRPEKFLAGILIGNNRASASFQNIKKKTADALGWDYRIFTLENDLSQDEMRRKVGEIAAQGTCGGVVLQLPLSVGVNSQYVVNAIPPEKDPDGLSERSLGSFLVGRSRILQPAAAVVEEITRQTEFDLALAHVAVVGRGSLIGQPVATWLMRKAKSVVILGRHSDKGLLKEADLVILGAGKEGIVQAVDLKPGAAVIDFGYAPSEDGRLKGDLAPGGEDALLWYTPTPGGTGPILVAKLFENFAILNGSGDVVSK